MYQPVFRDVIPPDDCRQWWRLIRKLAEGLYDVNLPEGGRAPARARNLQTKLGVKRLPPSLVEWIAFLEDLKRRSDWATDDLTTLRAVTFPEHDVVSLYAGSVNDGWAQWCVAIDDFDRDDPPIRVYGYISTRNVHVLRKSYPRLPLTQFALHCLLDCAASNYGWMGSDLDDPDAFLRSLSSKVPVSAAFGSLRFIEGIGWLAYVRNGGTPNGRQKRLTLRFTEGVQLRDIPKPIRDLVQLKPSFLRPRSRREHRR